MGKRLILLLAFALVFGLTSQAYAEVQNIKVGGDITVLGISRHQFEGGTSEQALTDESHATTTTRIRFDADLTDNVSATVRLLNERDWSQDGAELETIYVDLAYITLREFFYSPLTLTIGRQELHFGNDLIVGDPDTNNLDMAGDLTDADLSARKSFDAIRGTLDYDPLVIDLIWAKIDENTFVGTGTGTPEKDDEDLMGMNARYDFGGNWGTVGELYH